MAYLGILKRRACWVLTGRGWCVLFISVILILAITVITIHPFLSLNHPVNADILVVEGWLPDYALEKVIEEFRANNYQLLITTGTSLLKGSYLSEYKTTAETSAATIKQLGFDEKLIVAVSTPPIIKNRTYASAVALKKWLITSGLSIKSINLYSLGPHARRSLLLFQKAFPDSVSIGVIATDNLSYDPHYWWNSSCGLKTVINEIIAYFYARFLFFPKK